MPPDPDELYYLIAEGTSYRLLDHLKSPLLLERDGSATPFVETVRKKDRDEGNQHNVVVMRVSLYHLKYGGHPPWAEREVHPRQVCDYCMERPAVFARRGDHFCSGICARRYYGCGDGLSIAKEQDLPELRRLWAEAEGRDSSRDDSHARTRAENLEAE